MRFLLAIDPGLDVCGWARFSLPAERQTTLQAYGPCLEGSGTWRTPPGEAIEARLASLADQFLGAARLGATLIALEVPARTVAYRRNNRAGTGILAGLCHLNRVIGLFEGLSLGNGYRLRRVPAGRESKGIRHSRIRLLWPDLGRTQEDQRDAIALGLGVLLNGRGGAL